MDVSKTESVSHVDGGKATVLRVFWMLLDLSCRERFLSILRELRVSLAGCRHA